MTQYRINQFVVGSFVLAGLATLFIALALLTGRTGPSDRYYTLLDNVAGVKYGTPVVYEGFHVGQVESIEPDQSEGKLRFRLQLSVRKDWRIPTDSITLISAPGVLAAKSIMIRGGKATSYFEPGDTLPSVKGGSMFAALGDIAQTFADLSQNGLLPLISNLNEQISSAGALISGDLKSLVQNLQTTSTDLQQKTPAILNNVESFTNNLAAAGKNMEDALNAENMAAVDRILANADQTSARLANISKDIKLLLDDNSPNVKAASDDLRFTLETVARHIDSLTHNLDAASLQLLEFSRQIRNNPSTLIRGTEPASGEEVRGPNQ